ncbi:MAG: hypothetical protein V4678_02035 [Patescibacteria group bacterium]
MAFNHYAKIQRILQSYPEQWYVVQVNEPTSAKKFNGETAHYDYYYRVYSTVDDQPIKFCKFQQLERFAAAMQLPLEAIPVVS